MEVILNTNHSQMVSTQCSKTFSGTGTRKKKKKKDILVDFGRVFHKFLGPSKDLGLNEIKYL